MNSEITIDTMRRMAEDTIAEALSQRDHPARFVTFCTIGPNGATGRTVMLRDWQDGVAIIQTDAASHKMNELEADDRATIVLWHSGTDIQLRMATRVSATRGPSEDWGRMPAPSRLNYGGHPSPGSPMVRAEDYVPGADPARFAVLQCEVYEMDLVHLGRHMHRRVLFSRTDGVWVGQWVAP